MRVGRINEGYSSLRDVHLAHYFSRSDVLRHLVQMGLVTRTGEVVPEAEWRRLYAKEQREAKEREKEEHRRRLQEAEEASKRRIKEKIRRRELHLARPPSTSEPDLIHFDIEWNFRPVSVTTEEARTSSGTPGASNGTNGASNSTPRLSDGTLGHLNGNSGPSNSTPDWAKPPKFLQKPKFIGRRGVVGEPYVASLGPNPSPRYIHILKPTNSCKEVWARLCPPQPASSRLPRPQPPPAPQLRLVYAGGGAPCHTPTTLSLLQQPAGAHNVTIFQGVVCVGDEIEVTSMRRPNFPFSITIYENSVATGRLSACCEHRYAAGSRLGGRSGHLKVLEIIGGEPCLRCQLRAVEKRHQSRKRVNKKKARIVASPEDNRPYTPPEDTGSESGTTEEASTSSKRSSDTPSTTGSSSTTHRTEESRESSHTHTTTSDSTSSDIDSMILQHRLDVQQERYAHKRRRRYASGESCNGPSDLEVAAVLGVDMRPSEHITGKERPRSKSRSRKTSLLRQSNSHTTEGESSKEIVEDNSNHRNQYSSSKKSSCRSNLSSSEGKSVSSSASFRKSQRSRRRPSHISSSLEGQLDDSFTRRSSFHQDSTGEFSSRPGSSKSRRKQHSSGRSSSKGEDNNRVDSFYSQQVFTPSSGSESHVASGNVTEVSYGSSWEEEEEEEKKDEENEEDTEEDEEEEENKGEEEEEEKDEEDLEIEEEEKVEEEEEKDEDVEIEEEEKVEEKKEKEEEGKEEKVKDMDEEENKREVEEEKDTIKDDTEKDETKEHEDDASGPEEVLESEEKSMENNREEKKEASVASEVENEDDTTKDEEIEDEENIYSVHDVPASQEEPAKVSASDEHQTGGKSEDENTISEDVGEDSDIVTLCSSSEANVTKEDGIKGQDK